MERCRRGMSSIPQAAPSSHTVFVGRACMPTLGQGVGESAPWGLAMCGGAASLGQEAEHISGGVEWGGGPKLPGCIASNFIVHGFIVGHCSLFTFLWAGASNDPNTGRPCYKHTDCTVWARRWQGASRVGCRVVYMAVLGTQSTGSSMRHSLRLSALLL